MRRAEEAARTRAFARDFVFGWALWVIADIVGWDVVWRTVVILFVLALGLVPWLSAREIASLHDWRRRVVESRIAGKPEPLPPNMEAGLIRRLIRKFRRA